MSKKPNRKKEYRSPEEHFSEETPFEMPNSIRYDYGDEEMINELFLSGNKGIGEKHRLALLDESIDAHHLKANSVFANIKNHRSSFKKGGVTNEAVKYDLVTEYLQNPREHTQKAITTILNNISRHYTLSEEEEKLFSMANMNDFDERERIIGILDAKGESGDRKLAEALSQCNKLLNLCGEVEANQEKNYGKVISRELESLLDKKFSRYGDFLDVEKFSKSEKDRLYKLAIIASSENLEGMLEDGVEAQQKIIDEFGRKFLNEDMPQNYADFNDFLENKYLKDASIMKELEVFTTQELMSQKDRAGIEGKTLSSEDIKEIEKNARYEFIYSKKRRDISSKYKNFKLLSLTGDFIRESAKIDSLHKESIKAIEDSAQINRNIRADRNFVFMYEQMSKATNAFKMGDGARQYELRKIQREMLFHYNNDKAGFGKFIDNAQKTYNKLSGDNKDFIKMLKKRNVTEEEFKAFSSAVLTEALKSSFDTEQSRNNKKIHFSNKDKQIVGANLAELAKEINSGKQKRLAGKPFSWNEMVSLYDDFQEKNILEITQNRIAGLDGIGEETKKKFLDEIKKVNEQENNLEHKYASPNMDKKDEILDVMNFNNITGNKYIQSHIEKDEIDSTIDSTISHENTGLRDTARETFLADKKYTDSKKKGMSHDERIRDVAGHYYSDYANSLMRNSIVGLASKRETFQNFSSCVKGASVMQRNMDTKLSNTTNCLKEFKNSLKKDADDFQREISASIQGVGALNPFMHIAQVVAISRKLMAERIESNMREIADSINGISREVSTAETEIERRARNTILMAKSDRNVNIQSVHNSEKEELSDKLKQEYITREMVDFKEAGTKFSDANPLEILEEYEVPYKDIDKFKKKEDKAEPQQPLNMDAFRGAIRGFDGTYKEGDVVQENPLGESQNIENELENSQFADEGRVEDLENKEAIKSTERQKQGAQKLSEYNSAMLEDALLKMDTIQKKMAEMSLASKNDYSNDDFLNGTSSTKVTAERLGFILSSEDEQKELGLENWESKEMRDWMQKNNISKELLEKSLEKGHKVIEQEKLALNYQLIIKSLEEMREKGGIDAVRPKSKLNDIINEAKRLFSEDGKKMSKLEKRNTLSSAVSMLHNSSNYKRTMETMFNTSSMETETVKSQENSEISLLGVADKEKAYILKVHKEQKVEELRREIEMEKFLNENSSLKEEEVQEIFKRDGFEDLSYKADIELLRGTKMVGSETSLNNWSDLLENGTNFTTYNNGVRDINQEMAQINNSAIDYGSQSRGDVDRGGFVAPDDNDYVPSK